MSTDTPQPPRSMPVSDSTDTTPTPGEMAQLAYEEREPSITALHRAQLEAEEAAFERAREQTSGIFPPSKAALGLVALFFAWGAAALLITVEALGVPSTASASEGQIQTVGIVWLCLTVWGYYPVVAGVLELEHRLRTRLTQT